MINKINYTPKQEEAIKHRGGNLLILACAGSGKTEVVARRIAMLVKEGVQKKEIIAFTFTEKAAAELKARIRLHLEDVIPENPALGDMYVGTIHSFCLNFLKEIDSTYRKFEVMDEARQAALIMTNYNRIGLDKLRKQIKSGRYWEAFRKFIVTLNIVFQKNIKTSVIQDKELREAIENYQTIVCDSPNYFFDFNQIIIKLLEKLRSDPSSLKAIQQSFKYLVVDEYQDVDDRQEELIELLSGTGKQICVTVVGDDDQAIYGWRGASIKNILNFAKKYPAVKVVELSFNFRSTHAIVEIANNAVRQIPQDSRINKDMQARRWDGQAFVETLAEKEDVQVRTFVSDEAEATWVAERIEQLRGVFINNDEGKRSIDYADFAILLRSVRSSGRIFASVLEKKRIPFVIKGAGGLFEDKAVLLIHAAFCLLARTKFRFEYFDEFIEMDEPQIREFIREKIKELSKIGFMPQANGSIFLEWVAKKKEELDKRNLEKEERGRLARRIYPQEIYREMLNVLGIAKGDPWDQGTLFNLGRLSSLITQFEAVHQWIIPNDLVALCIFLGGWAAGEVDEGRVDETITPNAVQIMTVHAAKGLEWPVVFLPRVSSANFPSSRRKQGPQTFLNENTVDLREYIGGDVGERRLWYVALTRCQKFLNISSPDRRAKRPTPFLKEITHDYVQRKGTPKDKPKGAPTPPTNAIFLPTTYSELNYYWRCPYEYELRTLMGFAPGVKESYGYGQQMHNILAEIHKNALQGIYFAEDDVKDLIETHFHLRYTRNDPLTYLKNAAAKALKNYIRNYYLKERYVVDIEKAFEFIDKESEALISGKIDLLEKIEKTNSGNAIETKNLPVAVVDFKNLHFRDIDEFQKKKAEVEDQLRLYALAVHKALGLKAEKAFAYFLSPNGLSNDLIERGAQEKIDVDISAEKQNQIKLKVKEAIKDIKKSIKNKKFDMKGCKTGACRKCDFHRICSGYSEWEKNDISTPRPVSSIADMENELLDIIGDTDAG